MQLSRRKFLFGTAAMGTMIPKARAENVNYSFKRGRLEISLGVKGVIGDLTNGWHPSSRDVCYRFADGLEIVDDKEAKVAESPNVYIDETHYGHRMRVLMVGSEAENLSFPAKYFLQNGQSRVLMLGKKPARFFSSEDYTMITPHEPHCYIKRSGHLEFDSEWKLQNALTNNGIDVVLIDGRTTKIAARKPRFPVYMAGLRDSQLDELGVGVQQLPSNVAEFDFHEYPEKAPPLDSLSLAAVRRRADGGIHLSTRWSLHHK